MELGLMHIAIAVLLGLAGGLKVFALAANRELNRYVDQELRTLHIAANVHIYKGALVGLTGGYARPLVAGDRFAGIAYEECDNTGGQDGDRMFRAFVVGDFEHTLNGAAIANNRAMVYASADDTITLTSGANSFVGQQMEVPAANTIVLRIDTRGAAPLAAGGFQLTSRATVAAAGNNQATATALTADNNSVTAADDAKGVKLPVGVAGMRIFVKNTVANKILKIYPNTDAAINAIAANGSLDIAAATSVLLVCDSPTQWYSLPLLPS